MPVQVYGCNHIVIEVTDAKKAVKFYSDVFGLKMLRGGEGAAWCKLGEHQFMAIFEVEQLQPDRVKHFGLMVRDAEQIKVWIARKQLSLKSKQVAGKRLQWCSRQTRTVVHFTKRDWHIHVSIKPGQRAGPGHLE